MPRRRSAPELVRRHTVELAGLPEAHDGLKVVQLSDIHVGRMTPDQHVRACIDAACAEKPDVIVITGDFISHGLRAVARMRAVLHGLPGTVVATLGNHDHWTSARAVTRELEHLGYIVLRNRWTTLRLRGADFRIVGVDDAYTGHADVAEAMRGLPADGAPLWLSHIPEVVEGLPEHAGGSLVLSGHTHGGQVHLPLLTPALAKLARHRYLHGFYASRGAQLYVNRGVGVSALPVRIGVEAQAEVASFTLRRAA